MNSLNDKKTGDDKTAQLPGLLGKQANDDAKRGINASPPDTPIGSLATQKGGLLHQFERTPRPRIKAFRCASENYAKADKDMVDQVLLTARRSAMVDFRTSSDLCH